MARPAPTCGLGDAVHGGDLLFSLAGPGDEPDIRRLLREIPLGGEFQITLEREPNAFAGDFGIARAHVFLIARDRSSGEAIGLCERVVRDAYVDGEIRALPYLGALRLMPHRRARIRVLRDGFAALQLLAERADETPFALTSITSDNAVARRLLTAGVPGLPNYRFVGDFSTFALRPRRARTAPEISFAGADDIPALAAFLQRLNSCRQFAQVWTANDLRGLAAFGLPAERFLLFCNRGEILGCLGVWDQTEFRQVVVRRYPSYLRSLRPLANILAPVTGLPCLPQEGEPLRQIAFTHLAVEQDDPEIFLSLVEAGLDLAHRLHFGVAAIGFASSRVWTKALKLRSRAIEYRTSLYLVHWLQAVSPLPSLEEYAHPEMALL